MNDTPIQSEITDEKVNDAQMSEQQSVMSEQTEDQRLIEELENKTKEWENLAKRYAADLKNLANQHSLDLQQTRKITKKISLSPVLEFLNTLHLAFSFSPETEDEKVIKFINTLKTSYEKVITDLDTQGYNIIQPNTGESFDPESMNALNQNESNEHPNVKHTVSMGCKIDGVVVTPAMVMI